MNRAISKNILSIQNYQIKKFEYVQTFFELKSMSN